MPVIQDAKIFLERWTQLSGALNADVDLGSAEFIDDKPAMGWCTVAATINSAIRPGGIRENTSSPTRAGRHEGAFRLAKENERYGTKGDCGWRGW